MKYIKKILHNPKYFILIVKKLINILFLRKKYYYYYYIMVTKSCLPYEKWHVLQKGYTLRAAVRSPGKHFIDAKKANHFIKSINFTLDIY